MKSSRSKLLSAAGELFVKHGRAVSMSEVRRRAGVSNGSLFHHFPTRDSLLVAVYVQVLEEYQAELLTAIGPGVPAAGGIRALATRHYVWVNANPDDARLLRELRREAESAVVDGAEQPWAAANRRTFDVLAEWVVERVAAGDMAPMPFKVWATMVLMPLLALSGDDNDTQTALSEALVRAVTVA